MDLVLVSLERNQETGQSRPVRVGCEETKKIILVGVMPLYYHCINQKLQVNTISFRAIHYTLILIIVGNERSYFLISLIVEWKVVSGGSGWRED